MRTFVWVVLIYNCVVMTIKLISLVISEEDKKYNALDFLIQLVFAVFALKALFLP
jgi:hypothetical protein